MNPVYLTNREDSAGLLSEACDSDNNSPHKAKLLLNSQTKKSGHVYLVPTNSSVATAESFTSFREDPAPP